jgi:hypothetical protein
LIEYENKKGSKVVFMRLKVDHGADRTMIVYLHPDNGVYEEQHGYQQTNIWQRFEGLNERPKQNSDCVALTQEFDQTCSSKESQESNVERILLLLCKVKGQNHISGTQASEASTYSKLEHEGVDYTSNYCYEIKHIPRILEKVLSVVGGRKKKNKR